MLTVIGVFVIVVIAVVIVVVGAVDVLFFQRRKSWCSCANFFSSYFQCSFLLELKFDFFFAFAAPMFFRRAYVYQGVSFVEVRFFV